jgi:8-oxo-dGTP pyrophosphatase MutT (NUDIX family)
MLTLKETADLLERRLLPKNHEEPPADGRWRAAVVMILREPVGTPEDEGIEALFIKRAVNPRDTWSGHMALPGGRWQAEDASLVDTAIRETKEEVGIDLAGGRFLGRLGRLQPVSPYIPPVDITPYVALAPESAVVTANAEVADHFWIPVELLRRVGPTAFYELVLADGRRKWPAYPYRKNLIWGLTERILSQFLSSLSAA